VRPAVHRARPVRARAGRLGPRPRRRDPGGRGGDRRRRHRRGARRRRGPHLRRRRRAVRRGRARERRVARRPGPAVRRPRDRPGGPRLQLQRADGARPGGPGVLPVPAGGLHADGRAAARRRDDGVPQARRAARPPPDQGDRRGRPPAAARRRPRRAARRVGRVAPVHPRRPAADRRHPLAARLRRGRPRHVGHHPRPGHRPPPRRADRHRRPPGRAAAVRPAPLTTRTRTTWGFGRFRHFCPDGESRARYRHWVIQRHPWREGAPMEEGRTAAGPPTAGPPTTGPPPTGPPTTGEPADAPAAVAPLTRAQKTLAAFGGLLFAGLAGLGGYGSFASVRDVAEPWFGDQAWIVPAGVDLGILALVSVALLLEWLAMPMPALRWMAFAFTGATVWLNVSAAHGDATGMVMHAAMPVLFITFIEAVRHAVRRRAGIAAGTVREGVPVARWLLAPVSTFRLWRRMVLWQITSYPRALTAEQRRRRALALLTEHYGRKWKSKAPADVVWMLSDGVMLDEALARVTEITAPEQDPPE